MSERRVLYKGSSELGLWDSSVARARGVLVGEGRDCGFWGQGRKQSLGYGGLCIPCKEARSLFEGSGSVLRELDLNVLL